jgi:nucleotide-binding universal stress UspA family protein
MFRRILVLLEDTMSSVSARQYALQLARSANAELAGLAGIDLAFIEATIPGRAGTTSYKAHLEMSLKKQARANNLQIRETFEAECGANEVRFVWQSFEGEPISAICSAAESCDLVITGYDTAFRGKISEHLPDMIESFLLLSPRPTIICPDRLSGAEEMMIAYDNSPPAMRAIQMFALLRIGIHELKHVTAISRSHDGVTTATAAVINYLTIHGYHVEENPIKSNEHPAKVLKDEVTRLSIGTLIMGAYGHNRLRNFLFGSTTKTLIEAPPCALFLYH